MNNNDILKKLRVALQLRDDQIVEILELVDFRISKGEIGNFFRNDEHPKYVECGDQILRNFLNGLVIHLRGTKENPKNPKEVLEGHKKTFTKDKKSTTVNSKEDKDNKSKSRPKTTNSSKKNNPKTPLSGFKFNNGKQKRD
ncbi:DUF1456 family protein [Myroides albus]|uniref:DUF1456 family protein n=1 Tax=Myroides albus TaxID=2562892 RepID=A0A6I3LLN8_9FLAO|nr:DUF1456 family protein [Myroides albus]MTG98426.1 DUF1456 family protein [Myroides albus]UVD79661.1 DUF1456 family protein [Myroides albus]